MTSIGTIGNMTAPAAKAAETAAAEMDSGKDDAGFQKQLSKILLTAATNSLMDAHDTMRELEDDEEE
jgi:hypothetical protein